MSASWASWARPGLLSMALTFGYWGLLALLVRLSRFLPPPMAAFVLAASLPLRLALFAVLATAVLRVAGGVAAIFIVLGLWLGRLVVNRVIRP